MILLEEGKTYNIATRKLNLRDLRLCGGEVLSFFTQGRTALSCSGDVYIDNIQLDGNNLSNELVRSAGEKFHMIGCIVRNVFNSDCKYNITSIQLINCKFVEIDRVIFSPINGQKNGIIGDQVGAAAAVQISGKCSKGIITNLYV